MLNLKKNKNDDVKNAEDEIVIESSTEAEKEVSRKEIDNLKSDVEKLSGELNSAVTSLKKSVVDIRSAVSEIENPFNLLRAIQGEKEMKDLNHERLPDGVRSLIIPGPKEGVAGKEEPKETALLEESTALQTEPEAIAALLEEAPALQAEPEQEPDLLKESPEPQTLPHPEEELPQLQRPPPKGTSDYLDWVWAHIDSGLSADDVFALAKSYEFLGYLPEEFGECIYHLALAAEKMKSAGFSKKHLLLNMFQAASISGIQIGLADVNKLVSIVEGKVKRGTRPVRTRS